MYKQISIYEAGQNLIRKWKLKLMSAFWRNLTIDKESDFYRIYKES